ncbi:MAG: DNA-processing protein DprA [Planctomycetota bacterium]
MDRSQRKHASSTAGDAPVAPSTLDTASMLQLAMLPGLGPRTLTALLDHFDTPDEVLCASTSELIRIQGVGKELVHKIQTASDHVAVGRIRQWCDDHNVQIVDRFDDAYPYHLQRLSDAPPLLFVQGDVLTEDEIAVAIVGTRHASPYGLRQAERFGYSLAQAGVTVISGLARGIDTAAHEGALNGGGRTLAVLGSGLKHIYPSENQKLAAKIAASGAVISEYAPDTKPRGGLFPQRNRLIAGISLATLVIEAPERSGSLITARLAMEQNRDVLAVPGSVESRASRGCNRLIRDGAVLVQTVDDVLEAIGPMERPAKTSTGAEVRRPSELQLNELETKVLQAIETTSTAIDQVIQNSQLPASRVISIISVLEMRCLVRRLSGQYVSRV